MGLKNDIKFKILQELMQETNIERPIIHLETARCCLWGNFRRGRQREEKEQTR